MRRQALLLIAIMSLGTGLRFFSVDAKGLWLDESLSWRLQNFGLSTMIERTGESSTVHPPLYFALLHVWTMSFGDSEFALRCFSALAGVLAVPGIYLLVEELAAATTLRLGGTVAHAGLLAAGLVAVSPFNVYLSHQVRGYTLGIALFLLSSWLMLRSLHASNRRSARQFWLSYAGCALAFCYTHYLAIFSAASQFVYAVLWLWWPQSQMWLSVSRHSSSRVPLLLGDSSEQMSAVSVSRIEGRRCVTWAAMLLAVGYLPWISVLWRQAEAVRTSWYHHLDLTDCVRVVYSALLATPAYSLATPATLTWAITSVLGSVLIYVAVRFRWTGTFLLLTGLLPVLLNLAYSRFSIREIFEPRYLAFAQVAWLASVALAISSAPSRPERCIVAAVVLMWFANSWWENWELLGPGSEPGVRGAVAYIMEQRSDRERVVALTPFVFFQMSYYMRGDDNPILCVSVTDRRRCRGSAHLLDSDLMTASQIMESKPRGLWLVTTPSYDPTSQTEFDLPQGWRREEQIEFAQDGQCRAEGPIFVRHCLPE